MADRHYSWIMVYDLNQRGRVDTLSALFNFLIPERATMTLHTASQDHSGVKQMRNDFRTRDVINQAIASIPTVGLQRAAEFLSAMNVPAELAVRTLVYPNRRRQLS